MPEDPQGLVALVGNIARDTSQIKTDLAVNTTKTGYIEEHLRTLNGKVIKQEERLQIADKERGDLTNRVIGIERKNKRWDDGWIGVMKQLGLFALGLVSAYLINRYFK